MKVRFFLKILWIHWLTVRIAIKSGFREIWVPFKLIGSGQKYRQRSALFIDFKVTPIVICESTYLLLLCNYHLRCKKWGLKGDKVCQVSKRNGYLRWSSKRGWESQLTFLRTEAGTGGVFWPKNLIWPHILIDFFSSFVIA